MDQRANLVTLLSTRTAAFYRLYLWGLNILLASTALAYILRWYRQSGTFPFIILGIGLAGFQIYRMTRLLRMVAFDTKFLYVTEKGYDVLVPLENIRNIEIQTLGGIYKIRLLDVIQLGDELLFKPSLWYPIDHAKQEKKIELLSSYIRKAKIRPLERKLNRRLN